MKIKTMFVLAVLGIAGCGEDPERIQQAAKCYNNMLSCPGMLAHGYEAGIDMHRDEMLRLVKIHVEQERLREIRETKEAAAEWDRRQVARKELEKKYPGLTASERLEVQLAEAGELIRKSKERDRKIAAHVYEYGCDKQKLKELKGADEDLAFDVMLKGGCRETWNQLL